MQHTQQDIQNTLKQVNKRKENIRETYQAVAMNIMDELRLRTVL